MITHVLCSSKITTGKLKRNGRFEKYNVPREIQRPIELGLKVGLLRRNEELTSSGCRDCIIFPPPEFNTAGAAVKKGRVSGAIKCV